MTVCNGPREALLGGVNCRTFAAFHRRVLADSPPCAYVGPPR